VPTCVHAVCEHPVSITTPVEWFSSVISLVTTTHTIHRPAGYSMGPSCVLLRYSLESVSDYLHVFKHLWKPSTLSGTWIVESYVTSNSRTKYGSLAQRMSQNICKKNSRKLAYWSNFKSLKYFYLSNTDLISILSILEDMTSTEFQ
jgi:hypothetical protein